MRGSRSAAPESRDSKTTRAAIALGHTNKDLGAEVASLTGVGASRVVFAICPYFYPYFSSD
jgi:hypothetical protein